MGGLRESVCPEDALGAIRRELGEGMWYLATVYTSHPDGLDVAYRQANEAAARVVRIFGARVFCPIAHSHSLCEVYGTKHGLNGETDAEFWKWFDEPFLERADGLIVVMMPNWRNSLGVTHEINETVAAGKPILYLSWPDLAVMRMTRGGDSACELRYPESELLARAAAQ
jgi:hypothetical protein